MRLITRFCVGLALLASMPLAAAAASRAVDVTAVVLPAPASQRAESPQTGRSAGPSDPLLAAPAAALQAPTNDNCASAITIPCGNINLSGDTFLATNDYDFSDTTLSCTHYSAAGHDVVYKLTAQVGDQIWVDYQSLADASIYLVKDCSDVTHTCVAGADDGKQNEVEHLSYTFTTAGTYYLILDSYAPNSYGSWTLVGQFLSCGLTPPPNDKCPTGTPLSCGTNSYSGTTENAANDYFFPSLGASCANSLAGGRDVAFKISATAGDSINVQYTSSANAVAYILGDSLGDCPNMMSCVAGANATGTGGTETLAYRFTFSGVYDLILDSDGAGSFGTWNMTSTLVCVNGPPPNDLCSGAITIPCGNINLSGTTKYANNDYTVPVSGCTGSVPAGPDVVYKINAYPGDSLNITFGFPDNIQPSHSDGPDAVIYLVIDCGSTSTTCVAGRDVTVGGELETLSYKFIYGHTYYLILDSYDPTPGGNWIASGKLTCAAHTAVGDEGGATEFRLGAPAPNPFDATSTVRFSLATPGRVRLKIYDLAGRVVRTLVDGDLAPGQHAATWNGHDDSGLPVQAGTYYARLVQGGRVAYRTLIFIR